MVHTISPTHLHIAEPTDLPFVQRAGRLSRELWGMLCGKSWFKIKESSKLANLQDGNIIVHRSIPSGAQRHSSPSHVSFLG